MELPFAQRELTVAARSKSTYVLRILLVGAACGIMMLFVGCQGLAFLTFSGGAAAGPAFGSGFAEFLGRLLEGMVTAFQFAAVFLFTPMYTAGLVAQEKQDHTLSLLILADTSGRDLYFAKFLRAFVQVELLLLSLLPFAAFSALFGGVSVPEMAWKVALYSAYAAAFCSMGLLFSTVSSRPISAFFVTSMTAWLWAALAFVADIFMPQGATFLWGVNFSVFGRHAPAFGSLWPQFLLTAFAFAVCSIVTIVLLPRQVETAAVRRSGARPNQRSSGLLAHTPAEQFVSAGGASFMGSFRSPWTRLPAMAGLVVLSFIPCGTSYLVTLIMCYDIISALHAARVQGAMDELILTPLEDRAIGNTVLRVCLRHAAFYGIPMALGSLLFQAATYGTMGSAYVFMNGTGGTNLPAYLITLTVGLLTSVLAVLLRLAALAAGAGYIGLHSGTPVKLTLMALGMAVIVDIGVGFPSFFTNTAILAAFGPTAGPESVAVLVMMGLQALTQGGLYLLAFYIFRSLLLQGTRRQLMQAASPAL